VIGVRTSFQSSGSESSLGSASATADFLLLSFLSLGLPGVLPVPGHGPVGGTPAPSVVTRSTARSGSLSAVSAASATSGPAAVSLSFTPVAHLHFNSKMSTL